MPKTLQTILAALVTVISGWTPTTTLANDISDGILLLNGAHTALPTVPLVSAIYKFLGNAPANIANLEGGQLAMVGSESASFSGYEDDVLIFAVRKYKNGGAPAGSPADALKTMNGY